MEKATLREAYRRFTRSSIGIMKDSKVLDINALISNLITEYLETTVKSVDVYEVQADMLLCEYGHYDFTGDGPQFQFSFKRQLIFDKYDELGYYGLRIYYDIGQTSNVGAYKRWCEIKSEADSWREDILLTKGYDRIKGMEFLRAEFEIDMPH